MTVIGLVLRQGIEEARALGCELLTWAKKRKIEVVLEENTREILGEKGKGVTPEELVKLADPVVVLGGDGTLIGVAHHVDGHSPVLLGVNFGHLGFLTEISPPELFTALEAVLAKKALLGERSMILAQVFRNEKCIFSAQGVNDAVVQKGARDTLLDIHVSVNGEEVMRLRADGLIIATPTGSTAYSLAAGGSIVYPNIPVVLLTPVCAHSLTSRPLILPQDFEIKSTIPNYDGTVILSVDGQLSESLLVGDRVHVSKAKNTVKFVKSPSKSYFKILRTKLNWGEGNKSG